MNIQSLKGNKSVSKLFEKLAQNKRVPHAYIFSGQEGIGKKLYALYFAKILNCSNEVIKPCEKCLNCQKINKNIHPDVKIISTEKKQIKIEEIRDAISFTHSSPMEGKYKVIIIDDAHKMNQFSSNALLKTLEEPISNSIIILITSNEKGLLSTIQSRCVKIFFEPLSEEDLTDILIEKGHDREKIKNIVEYANGSIKVAEELIQEKSYELINELLETIENIKKIRFIELSSLSERILINNFEEIAINIMIKYFHRKIINSEDLFFSLNAYEKIVNFKRFLRYNISKSFILESLFLSIAMREKI